jgi:uncharacterized protein YdhG (YjbR/CyaY superfamily)
MLARLGKQAGTSMTPRASWRQAAEPWDQPAGPWGRASQRVKDAVDDPRAAAGGIDEESLMPPLRQTEEGRALALERELRSRGTAHAAAEAEENVGAALNIAARDALDIGGDTAAARHMVDYQATRFVRQTRDNARRAIQEADEALAGIDPQAGYGDISVSARAKVDKARTLTKDAADEAWKRVGWESPGSYDNTVDTINKLLREVGRSQRMKVVPSDVAAELKSAGYKFTKGQWVFAPGKKGPEPTVLRDIHGLRGDVGKIKKTVVESPGGTLSEERRLNKIEEALLADMEAVDADPQILADARAATDDLYTRFREGRMGQVLSKAGHNRERVLDVDTLQTLLTGRDVTRSIDQALAADPAIADDITAYLRQGFLMAAVRDGEFSKASAARYIANLRGKRVFDSLAGLEEELVGAASKANRAAILKERAKIVDSRGGARYERGMNKSLASIYLDRPVGLEAGVLLDKNNRFPQRMAARLLRRMNGDKAAEDGLRRSFLDSLLERSSHGVDIDGNPKQYAGEFTRLLEDNIGTIRSLGFNSDEIKRLRQFAKVMRQAQRTTRGGQTDAMTDIPGVVLERLSQIGGAKLGSAFANITGGGGAGVSLQSAQMGSSTMRQIMRSFRIDPAEEILQEAINNPKMIKALLLTENSPKPAQEEARRTVEAWLYGLGLSIDEEE